MKSITNEIYKKTNAIEEILEELRASINDLKSLIAETDTELRAYLNKKCDHLYLHSLDILFGTNEILAHFISKEKEENNG